MEKIDKVVLYVEETDIDSKDEWVSIQDNGDLRLDVNDCGQTPLKYWGDIDYEYWLNVDKDWKDTVLLLLIKEKFKRFSDLANWLEENKIPNTFGSWI